MKTLQNYAKELSHNRHNPSKLAYIHIDLAARYAYEAEERGILRILRAAFWRDHKTDTQGKNKSDTKIEMEWLLTEDGRRYNELKTDMDATEKMMRAITSISIVASHEIKNQL